MVPTFNFIIASVKKNHKKKVITASRVHADNYDYKQRLITNKWFIYLVPSLQV